MHIHRAQLPNRLVGPGRLEKAEEWIEDVYKARHFGTYQSTGVGYDYIKQEGQPKNGDGLGPVNRRKSTWFIDTLLDWRKFQQRLTDMRAENPTWESCEGIPFVGKPQPTTQHLRQNIEWAQKDIENGIPHSFQVTHDLFGVY